jgi:hypothetical protein
MLVAQQEEHRVQQLSSADHQCERPLARYRSGGRDRAAVGDAYLRPSRSQVTGDRRSWPLTPRSGTTLVWHSLLGWLEDLPVVYVSEEPQLVWRERLAGFDSSP